MSVEVMKRWKKSAIGGTTVTLIPSTTDQSSHPGHIAPTQIVITYSGTPPTDFWGTTTTDGVEYIEILRRVTS
jgi:hypothetical protein